MLYCYKDFFLYCNEWICCLYYGVCINLSFICLLCRYSLLVAFILCRANICRTSTELETSYRKLIENVQCFAFFVYKFYIFLDTWHCRINTIFVHFRKISNSFALASKQERKACQRPFFFLFLNLIQQFYVCRQCTYIDIVYLYIYANFWFYLLKC